MITCRVCRSRVCTSASVASNMVVFYSYITEVNDNMRQGTTRKTSGHRTSIAQRAGV